MLRGEVWWAKWPGDPSGKARPVVIVSNNYRNSAPNLLDVVAVKVTGLYRDDGKKKPLNPAEDVVVRFKKESIIRCAAVFAVEKSILQSKIAQVSAATLKEIDEKLKHVLDLG